MLQLRNLNQAFAFGGPVNSKVPKGSIDVHGDYVVFTCLYILPDQSVGSLKITSRSHNHIAAGHGTNINGSARLQADGGVPVFNNRGASRMDDLAGNDLSVKLMIFRLYVSPGLKNSGLHPEYDLWGNLSLYKGLGGGPPKRLNQDLLIHRPHDKYDHVPTTLPSLPRLASLANFRTPNNSVLVHFVDRAVLHDLH